MQAPMHVHSAVLAFFIFLTCSLLSTLVSAQTTNFETKLPVVVYQIPPQLTPDEQKWYKVFQEGNVLSEGWVTISTNILMKVTPSQQKEQQEALYELGDKIGREWAKNNEVRKINTNMLKKWGKILEDAATNQPEKLAIAIADVNSQVDAALH